MSEKTGLDLLREPFPPHQIGKLAKGSKAQTQCDAKEKQNCSICGGWHHPKMIHLDYVGHAALTDRLLDADPGWFWEPMALKDGLPAFDESGGLWIKLTVAGVTRYGYGNAPESEYKEVGSRQKEVIGDALRNAAMRFGAALELWHKGDLHVDEDKTAEDLKKEFPNGQPVLSGTHKPTDGAWESMTPDMRTYLMDLSGEVRSLLNKGDFRGAAEHIEEQKIDNDTKVALWTRFDSKERSALKKAFEEIRKAA